METTLHEKLVAIQSELKAPKDQKNTFGNYKYRSCEDILEALKPHLKAQGLVLTFTDEIVLVGTRYYVKSTAILKMSTGDSFFVHAFAREEEVKKGMDGSQITGAASSYARKYALNALFLIDDTKDSDATNDHGKGEKPTKEALAAVTTSPAATPVKNKPTLVFVLSSLRAADSRAKLDALHDAALKHEWTEPQKKTINDCYENCIKKLAEPSFQEL